MIFRHECHYSCLKYRHLFVTNCFGTRRLSQAEYRMPLPHSPRHSEPSGELSRDRPRRTDGTVRSDAVCGF